MDIQNEKDSPSLNQMFGTYADVLFVLFPFLVIIMQEVWNGNLAEVLLRPDLSIASAILAGLAIGRFVLGLVTDRGLSEYKERIVFFIALTLFLVMGPSMILVLSIEDSETVPGFVAFLQPVLLIVAISLYTAAITISNMMGSHEEEAPAGGESVEEELLPEEEVTPLEVPRRPVSGDGGKH